MHYGTTAAGLSFHRTWLEGFGFRWGPCSWSRKGFVMHGCAHEMGQCIWKIIHKNHPCLSQYRPYKVNPVHTSEGLILAVTPGELWGSTSLPESFLSKLHPGLKPASSLHPTAPPNTFLLPWNPPKHLLYKCSFTTKNSCPPWPSSLPHLRDFSIPTSTPWGLFKEWSKVQTIPCHSKSTCTPAPTGTSEKPFLPPVFPAAPSFQIVSWFKSCSSSLHRTLTYDWSKRHSAGYSSKCIYLHTQKSSALLRREPQELLAKLVLATDQTLLSPKLL